MPAASSPSIPAGCRCTDRPDIWEAAISSAISAGSITDHEVVVIG
jgi:hypothetical protein